MTDTQTLTERDELVGLIKDPGFLRFVKHVQDEWVRGLPAKLKLAMSEAKTKGLSLETALEKVDYAGDQVALLIGWPEQRVQQLSKAESRRPFEERRQA